MTKAQEMEKKQNHLIPEFISFNNQKEKIGSESIFTQLTTVYHLPNEISFELINSLQDEKGFVHKRYKQLFNGIPVEGSMLIVHERQQQVQSVNGDVFTINEQNQLLEIAEANALSKALKTFPNAIFSWQLDSLGQSTDIKPYNSIPKATIVYVPENGDFNSMFFRKAYKFDIYAIKPIAHAFVYVDVSNGNILWKQERLNDFGVPSTAQTLYSGIRPIISDSLNPTTFRLIDTTRGGGIHTWNNTNIVAEFYNSSSFWNGSTSVAKAVFDAHWGAEKTYDYFKNNLNRFSFDNNNAEINVYAHTGYNMANAYWDGYGIYVGDGDYGYYPFTCVDVMGHEFTHGVTDYTAALIYSGESGALNESFSDIFGSMVKLYAKPTSNIWKVTEEATVNGLGIRSMSNPNLFNDPDTYGGLYWSSGGGVHTNSGVQNFWFYVLSDGDTGVNDLNHFYSVPGIGTTDASAIAYRTLAYYLTPSSNYSSARFYSIQSAIDLFGNNSPQMNQTQDAWYAVGVGTYYGQVVFSVNKTISCSVPATFQFTNNSLNVMSCLWNFGDSTTSTLSNPAHTYTSTGQFTVKLTITHPNNTIDSAVYVNLVMVDTNYAWCDTTILQPTTNQLHTGCSGVILDNGGLTSPYSPNANGGVYVSLPTSDYYAIRFTAFDLESYDSVIVTSDNSPNSYIIGQFSYSPNIPFNGNYFYTPSNHFYLKLKSDNIIQYDGFVAKYECKHNVVEANFSVNDTFKCNGVFNFNNTSYSNAPSQSNLSYFWDFGDGDTSTATNPTHHYNQLGTFTVKLIACNSWGCDTLIKVNYLQYDTNSIYCHIYPVPSSGSTLAFGCNGIITDNGGLNGLYTNNVFGGVKVSTNNAVNFKLRFNQFLLDGCCDTVIIYNGYTSTSPLLGKWYLPGLPNNGNWLYTSTNKFFVKFISGSSNVDSGFVIEYQCDTDPPIANFTSSDTNTCNGLVQFNNLSSPLASSSYWDFGDGSTSTLTNPQHAYLLPGNYTVSLIACNLNGCDTLTKSSFINYTTINNVSLSGPSSFCLGDSVIISANSSVSGLTYQWKENGNIITGATSSHYTAVSSGTYSVNVTNSSSCSMNSAITNVLVYSFPLASINSTGNTTFCQGDSIVLQANTGSGLSYQWQNNAVAINGETNSVFVATTSGYYAVLVSNIYNCATTSNIDTIIVNPLPTVLLFQVSTNIWCEGDSVFIGTLASNGVAAYQWKKNGIDILGATLDFYKAFSTGYYTVMVSSLGCSVLSNNTYDSFLAAPPVFIVQSGNTLSVTTVFFNYQWYLNGSPIAGATNQNFTPNLNGNYFVKASTLNNCTSQSNTISFVLDIYDVENYQYLTVYPNPVIDIFRVNINFKGFAAESSIEIMDVLGNRVGIWQLAKMFNSQIQNSILIDCKHWSSGVYFIRYKDNEGRTGTVKVVKE